MDRFADVDTLLAEVAGQHRIPGLAAAAIVDGQVAHVGVHGWRDLERGQPMTADTPSRWYSISKPLTALALAKLVDEGKLRWETPVAELVPGLAFSDPVATALADVADCLLHCTGLPSGDWTWWQAPPHPRVLLQRLPHVPCPAGLRKGYHYQNLGFTILGEVFKSAGTDWHSAMQELLSPLGIKPLTRLEAFVAAPRALGYGPNGFSEPVRIDDFDFEAVAPASAVCGSIRELAQVACALVARGGSILPESRWAEVVQPRVALPATPWPEMQQPCASLASRSVVYRGEWMMQWAGGWCGYVSHLLAIPSRGIAACALANRSASPAAELLALCLIDRAAGWNPLPWQQRLLEQKQALRQQAQQHLRTRLNRPRAAWPAKDIYGRFVHPSYGEFTIIETEGEPHLHFRHVQLPLVPRDDGSISADGAGAGFNELCWDLHPRIEGNRITAWLFNPDCPAKPCCFERVEDT